MVLLFGLIWLCQKIKVGEGNVRMSFRTRRWHVPSRNHEPSWGKLRFARSLHQSLSQFGQKNYRNMLVPCHETMPSFMIFSRVLELQELKNQVSQSFRPSHDAQMSEFHSHFLHGTKKLTKGRTCDFSTNFGAPEHVLVVQICIMHIKLTETWLMHKKAKWTRNNSKFRTRSWNVPTRNHKPSWRKLRFARSLHQSLSQFGQKITVTCWFHVMTPCQVSWFSGVFWIYMN